MSKKSLQKYLKSLNKEQLEEQVMDLYTRFNDVKTFYNFIFNPKEDKLLGEAKFKISKEYFPPNKRKAKARRSVAHKHIKHFLTLGVDAHLVADLMLYNIEIAQTYSADNKLIPDAFTKSMFKSFEQAIHFIAQNNLTSQFAARIMKVRKEAEFQQWPNLEKFDALLDMLE